MLRDLRLCFAILTAAVIVPSITHAAEIGVLPLAAPQVDAATRAMTQESLLTAVQALWGNAVEPGELKKRLGPALRQALECGDGECWAKIGARSGVAYLLSARGFGKKNALLLTVALIRTSDGKVIGRAQRPFAIDDPAALSASSEDIVRKLRESAAASAPELAPPVASAPAAATAAATDAGDAGDTVINDRPGDTGAPVSPLTAMPTTVRASFKPPVWKAGFGFVEDADVGGDTGTLQLNQALTVGALPQVKTRTAKILFMASMPAYASDLGAASPGVLRLRLSGEGQVALGDNALHTAPLVWRLIIPLPRILIIGSDASNGVRGWTQMLFPVGLSVDARFLRLAHGFTVGIGPHGSVAAGFLAIDAQTVGSTYVPAISGFSAEATYGGHLTSAIRLDTWELQLTGGVERLTNLVNSIGSSTTAGTTGNNLTQIYGAATFATLRLSASVGDLIMGVDYRGRMSSTPQQPVPTVGATYTYHAPNPNVVFGKELGVFVGAYF